MKNPRHFTTKIPAPDLRLGWPYYYVDVNGRYWKCNARGAGWSRDTDEIECTQYKRHRLTREQLRRLVGDKRVLITPTLREELGY